MGGWEPRIEDLVQFKKMGASGRGIVADLNQHPS